MSSPGRVALLLDGAYVIKRIQRRLGRFPTDRDMRTLATQVGARLGRHSVYRIFFYHADPYRGIHRHPITGATIDFGATLTARRHERLLKGLELSEDFAVRRGEVRFRGWQVRKALAPDFGAGVSSRHMKPNFVQKAVDMRIGLDMAALALKRLVRTVVLVTGDADMVPAMRFARREGLRVGLCSLGFAGIRGALRADADFVVDWNPDTAAP